MCWLKLTEEQWHRWVLQVGYSLACPWLLWASESITLSLAHELFGGRRPAKCTYLFENFQRSLAVRRSLFFYFNSVKTWSSWPVKSFVPAMLVSRPKWGELWGWLYLNCLRHRLRVFFSWWFENDLLLTLRKLQLCLLVLCMLWISYMVWLFLS